jgi:hypothetical protein
MISTSKNPAWRCGEFRWCFQICGSAIWTSRFPVHIRARSLTFPHYYSSIAQACGHHKAGGLSTGCISFVFVIRSRVGLYSGSTSDVIRWILSSISGRVASYFDVFVLYLSINERPRCYFIQDRLHADSPNCGLLIVRVTLRPTTSRSVRRGFEAHLGLMTVY